MKEIYSPTGLLMRRYQLLAIQNAKNDYKNGLNRLIIALPTGTGKTTVASFIASKPTFKKVLFLAHRTELIDQAFNEFESMFPLQTGIIKRKRFDIDKKFVIASIQTLVNRYEKIDKKEFDLLITDECHHYSALTYRKPIDYFNFKLMLGLTATPKRMDNLNLTDIFDKITYQYELHQAIKEHYLCQLDAMKIKTAVDLSKVKRTAGDFNKKELSKSVDIPSRNKLIAKTHIEKSIDKQAIIYCIDIQHCLNIKKAFDEIPNNDLDIRIIVSNENITLDRDQDMKDFKSGKADVMINCEIMTEGLDYMDIGAIHMARPTESETLYRQIIGRGTRLKSVNFINNHSKGKIEKLIKTLKIDKNKITRVNKGIEFYKTKNEGKFTQKELEILNEIRKFNKCLIFDYVDITGKHNLMNTFTLDKGKDSNKKTFITDKQRNKIRKAEKKRQEDKERREREVYNLYKRNRKVNLFSLPKPKISTSPRMNEPATEKQIAWLKDKGVYVEGNSYTKKQASEYISNFPATKNQIKALAKWNYNVSNGVTVAEARLAFDEIEEKQANKDNKKRNKPQPMSTFHESDKKITTNYNESDENLPF